MIRSITSVRVFSVTIMIAVLLLLTNSIIEPTEAFSTRFFRRVVSRGGGATTIAQRRPTTVTTKMEPSTAATSTTTATPTTITTSSSSSLITIDDSSFNADDLYRQHMTNLVYERNLERCLQRCNDDNTDIMNYANKDIKAKKIKNTKE